MISKDCVIAKICNPGTFPKRIRMPEDISGYLLNAEGECTSFVTRRTVVIPRANRHSPVSLLQVRQKEFSLEFETVLFTQDHYPFSLRAETQMKVVNVPVFVTEVLKKMNLSFVTAGYVQNLIVPNIFPKMALPRVSEINVELPKILARITEEISTNLLRQESELGIRLISQPKVTLSPREIPILSIDSEIYEVGDTNIIFPTWSWNAASRTLTLNGYHGTTIALNGNMILCLAGGSANSITTLTGEGICVHGILQIKGKGSLTIHASCPSEKCRGILADVVHITEANCKISVTSSGHAVSAIDSLHVSSATIEAIAQDSDEAAGLYAGGSLEIESSAIIARGTYGLYAGNVLITKGSVQTQGSYAGIYTNGICSLHDARVTSFGEKLGISAHKVEVSGTKLLSFGEKKAVSCVYEKIFNLPILAGDEIESMKTAAILLNTRHIAVGFC